METLWSSMDIDRQWAPLPSQSKYCDPSRYSQELGSFFVKGHCSLYLWRKYMDLVPVLPKQRPEEHRKSCYAVRTQTPSFLRQAGSCILSAKGKWKKGSPVEVVIRTRKLWSSSSPIKNSEGEPPRPIPKGRRVTFLFLGSLTLLYILKKWPSK